MVCIITVFALCVSCLCALTFNCFSMLRTVMYFPPFILLFCLPVILYLSLSPPPKTQIKRMMQTPRIFLMLDPFQVNQLASGPGKSRKHLFIADVKTSTTTYAFNIHVQNKMWH